MLRLLVAVGTEVTTKAIVGETRAIISVGVGKKVGVKLTEIDGVSDNTGVKIIVGVIALIRP